MTLRVIAPALLIISSMALIGAADGLVIRDITWAKGAPMRYMLKFQAQGVLGGRILCVGGTQVPGCGPDHASDRAWFFDPKTGSYEDLPPVPLPLGKPEGIVVGDDFYLMGGSICPENVAKGSATLNRRVWRLSRRTGAWRWDAMAPLPFYRVFPAIARVDKTILLIGGRAVYNPETPEDLAYQNRHPAVEISSVIAFDTERPEKGWQDLPPMPGNGRTAVAVATVGRKVYVFGGSYYKTWLTGATNVPWVMYFCGDAYALDFDKLSWRQLPDLPFPAWGMSAALYRDHSIIILGGEKNGRVEHPYRYADKWKDIAGPNSDVLVYDTQLENYRILPTPLPLIEMTEEYRTELAPRIEKAPTTDYLYRYDFSRGVRRNNTRISVLGDRLYVLGVVTGVGEQTAHATNELLIGTPAR